MWFKWIFVVIQFLIFEVFWILLLQSLHEEVEELKSSKSSPKFSNPNLINNKHVPLKLRL